MYTIFNVNKLQYYTYISSFTRFIAVLVLVWLKFTRVKVPLVSLCGAILPPAGKAVPVRRQ